MPNYTAIRAHEWITEFEALLAVFGNSSAVFFFFSLFREREMVPNSVVVVFKFPVEREKAPNSVVLLFFNSREREMAPKSAACLMLCVI